jgi:two-component system cell cycle sensor histidine kinase/response regulator CckA
MKTVDTNKKSLKQEAKRPASGTQERKLRKNDVEREQALFSIFDQMPAEVSVLDPNTHEILFMNRYARELYGQNGTGRLCYNVFYGYDLPCPTCNNQFLLMRHGDEPVRKEYFNKRVERHYLSIDNLIRWPDGRQVKLEIAVDITDKKQAEEKREESEQKYRDLAELLPQAVYEADLNGNLTFVNRMGYQMFGYSPDGGIEDKNILDMVLPQDRTPVAERIAWIISGNQGRGTEFNAMRADGTSFPAITYAAPILLDGNIAGMRGTVIDITALKEIENSLRESEDRYRKMIDHSNDVIYSVDLEYRITSISHSVERFLGYKTEEFLGKFLGEIEIMPPEYIEKAFTEMTETFSGKIFSASEYVFIAKDGRRVIGEVSGAPLVKDGVIVGLTAVGRDVTERKNTERALRESEERYRTIIDHSNDVIYVVDRDYRTASVSHSIERFLGYKPEDFIGRPLGEIAIMPPEYLERAFREITEVFSGKHFIGSEYVFIHKDGRKLIGEISAAPLLKDGEIVGMIAVGRDITERKQTEQSLRDMERRLHKAQKMEAIGTLAGGIAHDFNNLLMGIQGYASLSLMDFDPSHPVHEKLKRIEEQVQSGADLTRQLLGFARGGRYEVKPSDMNELLKKTSTLFGRTRKEITIHHKFEKNLWSTDVDRGQMEQIFMNLYLNAWHAMPGGGEIYLETENIQLDEERSAAYSVNPGEFVRISVTDTGVGMDEKTRERIFDPFFTTKGMGRGTGLGLATVYGIVKGHKGAVNVYSELGHGTTFNLYLPASEKKAEKKKAETYALTKGTETILLVDDEQMVLEVSRQMLQFLGYRVYGAASGQEAVAIYMEKRQEIDLVLLDMIMPGISGGQTFDRIREINPESKVLLSSGYSINGEAKSIMDRGCNGFIQKPFQIEKLSKKIREAMA